MIAKPPTLDDVAKAAGVSAATISRCINTPDRVAESTRLRIQKAIDDLGMSVHHSCFDLSPEVMDMINAGKVQFTIDQQQRLQGYMPVVVLHLYNNGAGLLPGANIPSGPGFVDKSNASSVSALAGIDR